MATVKINNFERYRDYAQYFTMTMAVVYGIYWLAINIMNTAQTSSVVATGNFILMILVLGGLVMGIMYLLHLRRGK